MALALIYVRQSHHKVNQPTVSPQVQEEACKALPAVAGCDQVEVYSDLDLSGGSIKKRIGLQRLMERIKTSKVDVVAAYDQSRTFRNTDDALSFYRLMEKLPIEVVFANGRFDRSGVGGFSYTVLAAAHEMERKMVGEKTSAALRYKLSRGLMHGPVPLGYIRKAGKIEVDPEWSEVVRAIFGEYSTGKHSSLSLAKKLNAEGHNPPGWRSGFRSDSLTQLLRHPAYIGKAKSDTNIKGDWEPIIEEEVWNRVQNILDGSKGGYGHHGPKYRAYAFRQMLVCADCGQHLYAATIRGTAFYRCRQLGTLGCAGVSIKEEALLPTFRSLMEWLETRPENASIAPSVKEGARTRRDIQNVSTASVAAQVERLEWMFLNGYKSKEEFEEKMSFLRTRMAEVGKPPAKLIVTGLVQAWDSEDNTLRLALIQNMFTGFVVRDGRIINYSLRPEVEEELSQLLTGYQGIASVARTGIQTRPAI